LLAVASVECEFEANRRAFGSGPTGLGWRSSASCSPSVVEQLWPADVLGQGLWTITMSRRLRATARQLTQEPRKLAEPPG
jgi:hypothetical protein